MSAVEPKRRPGLMSFGLRPMREQDLGQASEIERDAFPTLFSRSSFRRELKKERSSYLVAWRRDGVGERAPVSAPPPISDGRPLIGRLLRHAWGMWSRPSVWKPGDQFLTGFVGTWYMVDEAHIVSIGVRQDYRGRGIGELLLIGAMEQAMARDARVVTLEVRVSNDVARSLYIKYGFKGRGVRKAYYSGDREDAVIMTTDSIQDPHYLQRFGDLVRQHQRRWGRAERVLY